MHADKGTGQKAPATGAEPPRGPPGGAPRRPGRDDSGNVSDPESLPELIDDGEEPELSDGLPPLEGLQAPVHQPVHPRESRPCFAYRSKVS